MLTSLNALILAGGFGTRLQSVVKDIPKPMANVRGEPFLAHLIRYYRLQGITQFILSVGYKAEIIQDYFGDNFESLPIRYIHESKPLGTGGAIKFALENLPDTWLPNFILNGDTWYECDILQIESFALKHNNQPICLAVKSMPHNDRYGSVILTSDGLIKGFISKPCLHAHINAGCYYIIPIAVKEILKTYPEHFSFEQECLPTLAQTKKLSGFLYEAPFLDIGIPEDFFRASQFLNR